MTQPAEPTGPAIEVSRPVGGVAQVVWSAVSGNTDGNADGKADGYAEAADLEAAVRARADRALDPHGPERLRRLEISLPTGDREGRRVALRAGFRVEGVRRAVLARSDGGFDDLTLFARLDTDVVGGPVGFSAVMNTALPRTRMIAHVLIRDEAGRVLFCETRFKADWELPGGIVEVNETPRDAAAREVREELGVDRPVGALLAVDWMPPYLGWDDACELIFDGGTVAQDELAGFTLQPSEIAAVRLCTLAEAADQLIPLSLRRLSLITALAPGETLLLENGSLPA